MPRISVVAKNYAKTLFLVAKKNDSISKVSEELDRFKQNFSSSFAQELKNPVISRSELTKIINEVTSKFKLGALTSNLFSAIVKNRRLNLFPEIYEEFSRLVKSYEKILEVEISSAAEINLEEVKKIISKKYPDKTIAMKHRIDKDMIGGIQIKIGSQVIDASLKNQINKIREHCLAIM